MSPDGTCRSMGKGGSKSLKIDALTASIEPYGLVRPENDRQALLARLLNRRMDHVVRRFLCCRVPAVGDAKILLG